MTLIHLDAETATLCYAPDALSEAEAAFCQRYPTFEQTRLLDRLRAEEYGRLDRTGNVYLDYTGGGLYAESQLREHFALLSENVFGNPHSHNPTSMAMTERVEQARRAVLDYFNASPSEYTAIFTPNASGALKHVGECFPFTQGGHFLLTADNHNSVNGIREFARARGATVTYLPITPPDLRLDPTEVLHNLDHLTGEAPRLFALPAQSNFTGVQHPLGLIGEAKQRGWSVLLDAAAFVPSNRLDLSQLQPDFVSLSFYKMFGYPTGVGALLVRNDALATLRRPWFAGGTISIVSVGTIRHYMMEGEAAFEDGTVDYLNLPAVETGLKHLAGIGIDTIHERVTCLTGWLLDEMSTLRHSNGVPLVHIHGPTSTAQRGGTIAFNFFGPDGIALDVQRVEELANEAHISLRTGCFCNPGVGEVTNQLELDYLEALYEPEQWFSYQELRKKIAYEFEREVSALRISVGLASTFADAHHFMRFAAGLRDLTNQDIGLVQSSASATRHVRDTA